jgi:hypothetical protein
VRWLKSFVIAVLLACGSEIASAHHGKDFLLVESYDLPAPEEFYLVGAAAVSRAGNETSVELEPSILVGVLPRFAFELHSHITKESHENLRYEATAPSVHLQLTPQTSDFPVQLACSAEYEIATSNGQDRLETRLILEKEIARWKLVGNLIGQHEQGGHNDVGYGIGARYDVNEMFACGFEAQGPFTNGDRHELLIGAYFEPKEFITLKLGAGPSINGEGAGVVVRFGVVWRF